MANDYRRIELITGEARRRHWSTEQKLQIIEESFLRGETPWRPPNLLYRWRRLLTEGGAAAVGSDEPVVGSSEVQRRLDLMRRLYIQVYNTPPETMRRVQEEALALAAGTQTSDRLLANFDELYLSCQQSLMQIQYRLIFSQ